MFQRLALAATAAAFLAAAVPAEAAMPGPAVGGHQAAPAADYVVPAKAKKRLIHVKKRVCHPVYKTRWVWRHGHIHKVTVRVGHKCTWRWVPIWRWY